MNDSTIPTSEGRRRYPADDGWYVIPPGVFVLAVGDPDRLPCTCIEGCPVPCRGACGCEACPWALNAFQMMGQTYMWDGL